MLRSQKNHTTMVFLITHQAKPRIREPNKQNAKHKQAFLQLHRMVVCLLLPELEALALSSDIAALGGTEGQCATTKVSDRRLVRLGTKTVWMLAACFSFSSPVLCVHVST